MNPIFVISCICILQCTAYAGESLAETFNNSTTSNLLTFPPGYSVGLNSNPTGVLQRTGIGDRKYITTLATDFCDLNFVFSLIAYINPINPSDPSSYDTFGLTFMGIGAGQEDNTFFTEPHTSAYMRTWPGSNIIVSRSPAAGPYRDERPFGSLATRDTIKMQISKTGDAITFSYDINYNGGLFDPNYSVTYSLSRDFPYLNSTNSRLFIGCDYPCTMDNVTIQVWGAASSIPKTVTSQIPDSTLTTLVAATNSQLLVFNGHSFGSGGSVDTSQPTFVITHGWNPLRSSEIPSWVTTLASALHTASPNANIVTWDWQSQAKGYLSTALSRTSEQGTGLGKALTETLGAMYFRNIHFLGHSLGTIVNARAAEAFHVGTSASKIQMTLFDDAEVGNLNLIGGDEESWKRPIPAGNIASRIDNYITSFGNPRVEALNVILQKGDNELWAAFHGDAQAWYAETANKTSLPDHTGINGSIIINEVNSATTNTYYYCPTGWNLSTISDYDNAVRVVKYRDFLFSTSSEGIGLGGATVSVQGALLISKLTQTLITGAIRGTQYFSGTLFPTINDSVKDIAETRLIFRAEKHSPAYGWMTVAIPAAATGMSFNFKFTNLSADDALCFGIDDQLLFGIEAKYVKNLSENNSGYIDVSQWSGTTSNIFIGLNSADENNVGGDVAVGNIQFYAKAAFDSWTAIKGLSSTDATATADPDKDGTQNLLEYAFGQEPMSSDHSGMPIGGVQNVDGADYLTLSYKKPKSVPDLMYAVEVSSDLAHWTTEATQFSAVDNGDNTETITFKDNSPQNNNSRRFMRVKVTH